MIKAVATLIVSAGLLTGLVACGGSEEPKLGGAAFITECKKEVDKNARAKAYSDDICTCVQDKLKEQGLGDKTSADKAVADKVTAATTECTRDVATGGSS